jgi:hypothetical protein
MCQAGKSDSPGPPCLLFRKSGKIRTVSAGGNDRYSAIAGKPGKHTGPTAARGNVRHKWEDVLVIGLVTLLCNEKDFEDMEAFGQEWDAELRKFLELPAGIPDESTFFRVFQWVHPKELSAYLYSWLSEGRELRQLEVNVNGKTIWGAGSVGKIRCKWSARG